MNEINNSKIMIIKFCVLSLKLWFPSISIAFLSMLYLNLGSRDQVYILCINGREINLFCQFHSQFDLKQTKVYKRHTYQTRPYVNYF